MKLKFSSLKFGLSDSIFTLLFLYMGVVYFSIAIANILLGLAFLLFIYSIVLKKNTLNFNKQKLCTYLCIITPFILSFVSFLNSDNTTKGFNYIWLRLPVLIIPFIFIFLNIKTKAIVFAIKNFVILSVIATLVTIYNAIRYINEDVVLVTDFTFLITIIQHPYFGVLALIALVSVFEFKMFKKSTLRIGIYFLLTIAIILSTSRLVYFLFVSTLAFYLFKNLSIRRALFFGVVLSTIATIFVVSNESIKDKFLSTINYENSPRLKLWNNAFKVLKSEDYSMTFGVGIGDYYGEKKDVYYFKESDFGTLGYNPHSQFVEFFVTNGYFGFIILLIVLLLGAKFVLNQDSYALVIFWILIAFACTESIFSRQYGVQMYSIFIPLIFKENFKLKE